MKGSNIKFALLELKKKISRNVSYFIRDISSVLLNSSFQYLNFYVYVTYSCYLVYCFEVVSQDDGIPLYYVLTSTLFQTITFVYSFVSTDFFSFRYSRHCCKELLTYLLFQILSIAGHYFYHFFNLI